MTPSYFHLIHTLLISLLMFNINVLQLNVQGIIGSEHKETKIKTLNTLFQQQDIHVVLLQEWSVQYRHNLTPTKPTITTKDGETRSIYFPIHLFPNYQCHYQDTNLCTLYRNDLNVHPIYDVTKQQHSYNKTKFNRLRCVLKIQHLDFYIENIYNPNNNDINAFFNNQYHDTDLVLSAGDINLHHQLWGDKKSDANANAFVQILNTSRWNVLSTDQFPTHYNKASDSTSSIDVIFGLNTSITNYHVHTSPTECIRDHYIITYTIPINNKPIYRAITCIKMPQKSHTII